MKKLLLLAAVGCLILSSIVACTKPDETIRVLQENGYTNITITGFRPWMKSENETFSTGFTAISPSGQPVSGAVTSRVLGGNTIRLD